MVSSITAWSMFMNFHILNFWQRIIFFTPKMLRDEHMRAQLQRMSHHLCSSHDAWFVCMHTSKIILLRKWYKIISAYLAVIIDRRNFFTLNIVKRRKVSLEVSEISISRGSPGWKKPWAIFANLKGDATLSTQGTRDLLRFSPNLNSLLSLCFWAAAVVCPGPVFYHDLNVQSSSGHYRQN